MENLLALDHQLFFLINSFGQNNTIQWVALLLSGIGMGGLVWLGISILLFFKEERRDHWFFLPVITATVLSQVLTNIVLKNFFGRNRPPGALLTSYSFPSGHATFAWALAVVLSAKEPRAKYLFYILAILISLSRVILGVHYPSDVIAGSFLGIIIGWLSLMLENFVQPRSIRKSPKRSKKIR